MGFLGGGTPLVWEDSKEFLDYIKRHCLEQFVHLFHLNKNRYDAFLKWGDEVEYSLIDLDEQKKQARLLIEADGVLRKLKALPSSCISPSSAQDYEESMSRLPMSPSELASSPSCFSVSSSSSLSSFSTLFFSSVAGSEYGEIRGELQSDWRPEYSTHMIEGIPFIPYELSCNILPLVEISMKLRRKRIQSVLSPNGRVVSITAFPSMGIGNFTSPPFEEEEEEEKHEEEGVKENDKLSELRRTKKIESQKSFVKRPKNNECSRSIFLPDNMINAHPRFGTLTANIRRRRGAKVAALTPVYVDEHTLESKIWEKSRSLETLNRVEIERLSRKTENPVYKYIYMDAMGFGMGMSCVQSTYLCPSLSDARYVYDQLAVLAPLWLALTAATPCLRGMLADTDTRWECISASVDCRTEEETGYIQKSRFSSVSLYISDMAPLINHVDDYNDTHVTINEEAYKKLLSENVDEILARHIAYLLIRDPLVIFSEVLYLDDTTNTTHFENIQSTNWNTVRFKPPLASEDGKKESPVGWRVEFRSTEAQFTDFENAAFVILISIIIQAILKEKWDLYIPVSLNDENMRRCSLFNAVLTQKFYFRHDITYNTSNREYSEMPLYNILFGFNYQKDNINKNLNTTNFSCQNCSPSADLSPNISFSTSSTLTPTPDAAVPCHCDDGDNDRQNSSSMDNTNNIQRTVDKEKNLSSSAAQCSSPLLSEFKGLVPLCIEYINQEVMEGRCSVGCRDVIMSYVNFIHDRACGKIPTNAAFLRSMVANSPQYKHDSIVPESLCYEMCKFAFDVGEGRILVPELYGEHASRVNMGALSEREIATFLSSACIPLYAKDVEEQNNRFSRGENFDELSPNSCTSCASLIGPSCMLQKFCSCQGDEDERIKNRDQKTREIKPFIENFGNITNKDATVVGKNELHLADNTTRPEKREEEEQGEKQKKEDMKKNDIMEANVRLSQFVKQKLAKDRWNHLEGYDIDGNHCCEDYYHNNLGPSHGDRFDGHKYYNDLCEDCFADIIGRGMQTNEDKSFHIMETTDIRNVGHHHHTLYRDDDDDDIADDRKDNHEGCRIVHARKDFHIHNSNKSHKSFSHLPNCAYHPDNFLDKSANSNAEIHSKLCKICHTKEVMMCSDKNITVSDIVRNVLKREGEYMNEDKKIGHTQKYEEKTNDGNAAIYHASFFEDKNEKIAEAAHGGKFRKNEINKIIDCAKNASGNLTPFSSLKKTDEEKIEETNFTSSNTVDNKYNIHATSKKLIEIDDDNGEKVYCDSKFCLSAAWKERLSHNCENENNNPQHKCDSTLHTEEKEECVQTKNNTDYPKCATTTPSCTF